MDKLTDTRARRSSSSSSIQTPYRRPTSRRRSSLVIRSDAGARFAGNVSELTRSQARVFFGLAGTASVVILVQAIVAGQFVAQPGNSGWIFAHGVMSYVTLAATLALAVFAVAQLRRSRSALTLLCSGLFVLTAVQTVIGYLITVGGQLGWVGVHVPLAFLIFGLTAWLSAKGAAIARAARRTSAA